jgi:hypothetical protein
MHQNRHMRLLETPGVLLTVDTPPANVVGAALVTAVAAILVPVITHYSNQAGAKKDQGRPSHQPFIQPQVTINYSPVHTTQADAPRRHTGAVVVVLAILAVGVTIIVALWQQTPNASPEAAGTAAPSLADAWTSSTTSGVPTNLASATLSLQESTQAFIAAYDQAYAANSSVETLDKFWSFPARWYNAMAVPNAQTLYDKP